MHRLDHLHSAIIGSGESVYHTTPHASPPPANELVVARGVGTEGIRRIAPGSSRSQARLRTRRSFRGTTRALFGSFRLIADHDQGGSHGYGLHDLPLDRRSPWGTALGHGV